jgi:hypothetical protein
MKRKDPRWRAGRGIVVPTVNTSATAASFLVSGYSLYASTRDGEV